MVGENYPYIKAGFIPLTKWKAISPKYEVILKILEISIYI